MNGTPCSQIPICFYYTNRISASAHKGPSYLSGRLRFMFVREPYSRLWSAYVDKFLLPDYWNVDGVRITRRRPGVSREAAKCGHDVTFAEFVDYVTSVPASKLNDHYGPYHLLCSPCLFLPHVIGKMETFDQDAKYVDFGVGRGKCEGVRQGGRVGGQGGGVGVVVTVVVMCFWLWWWW